MIPLEAIRDAVVVLLFCFGIFFFLVGTVGLVRLPDFFCRTHATSKCDSVGAVSLLLALAIHNGLDPSTLKILALIALVLLNSPTIGHALARAAHRTKLFAWHAERD